MKKALLWEDIVSNENLPAIMAGLDISLGDSVVSVCGGAGDAIFAMAEKAKRILAVDYEKRQLEYLRHRKKLLEIGNFEDFLKTDWDAENERQYQDLLSRNSYFSESRLKAIQKNLSIAKIESICMDIFALSNQVSSFNKLNLSNVLKYNFESIEELGKLATFLPLGSLIYTSDGNYTIYRTEPGRKDELSLPSHLNLRINSELTEKAQELQSQGAKYLKEDNWRPIVFQKIN
jgi:hypothetical protein